MLTSNLTPLVVPIVLWGLVFLSVVTWALFAIKLVQFARVRGLNRRFQEQFWAAGDLDRAEALAQGAPGSMAGMARVGFAVLAGRDMTLDDGGVSQEMDRGDRLERTLQQQIGRERRALESWLVVPASLGSTAPFIGLFGTVLGIMVALTSIDATGSTGLQAVAGPVGHALIATGLGIAVAVPSVLIYNFLVRRMKAAIHQMNDFAQDFYALGQQNGFEIRAGNPGQGAGPRHAAGAGGNRRAQA